MAKGKGGKKGYSELFGLLYPCESATQNTRLGSTFRSPRKTKGDKAMNHDDIEKDDELWMKVKVIRKDNASKPHGNPSILVEIPQIGVHWFHPSELYRKPKEICGKEI